VKTLAIGAIRAYQSIISPLIPPSCRFHPTCSEYTRQAIDRYGIVRGSLMGVWRILRCNPFCAGGHDPVR
jgi:putative membrane protein insertion efficiency factor